MGPSLCVLLFFEDWDNGVLYYNGDKQRGKQNVGRTGWEVAASEVLRARPGPRNPGAPSPAKQTSTQPTLQQTGLQRSVD